MKRGEMTFDFFRFSWELWCTPYVLIIIFPEERVLHCDFWFEKDGFVHRRILKLMNQTLDLSAGFWVGSLWYTPLQSALPARTLGRVLAAIYIWHIKSEYIFHCPACSQGMEEQHVRAPLSKIFSKLHLGMFAVSRRLKNAHKHMQSPSKVCCVCLEAE